MTISRYIYSRRRPTFWHLGYASSCSPVHSEWFLSGEWGLSADGRCCCSWFLLRFCRSNPKTLCLLHCAPHHTLEKYYRSHIYKSHLNKCGSSLCFFFFFLHVSQWKWHISHLSKLQHGLKRSTKIFIFSSSPKERNGMMRSRPCSTLGFERTKGVLIWSNSMTSWSLSPVSRRLPWKRKSKKVNHIIN